MASLRTACLEKARGRSSSQTQFTVVVAVFAVLAVDVALDDVVDVAVVRDCDVVAAHAVNVVARMRAAGVLRIARRKIRSRELMLVDVIAVRMVQVPIVNVIDVVVVDHGQMAARLAVFVLVSVVYVVFVVALVHGGLRLSAVRNMSALASWGGRLQGRSRSSRAYRGHGCRSSA